MLFLIWTCCNMGASWLHNPLYLFENFDPYCSTFDFTKIINQMEIIINAYIKFYNSKSQL